MRHWRERIRRNGPADLLFDVRHSARTLRRSPAFACTVVLLVAVGVGANSAVFSVLKAVLLDPLPYPEPTELAVLWNTDVQRSGRGPAAWPDYVDWRALSRSFEEMGATWTLRTSITDGDVPEPVYGASVTSSMFDVLGVEPALGRTILPEEDATDARVVVLSHELWRTQYGADPDILGRVTRLDGEPFTVVGVMPEDFFMMAPWGDGRLYRLWKPFPASVLDRGRDQHSYPVYGRMREGVSLDAARQDMERVALSLAEAHPETNLSKRVLVRDLRGVLVGDASGGLILVLGAAGMVLLIACGNVAGVLLARGARRRREVALRTALGAGPGRIVRQLLTESALLALAGGAVALLLSFWALEVMRSGLPSTLPRVENTSLDVTVMALALFASLLTGLAFGLAPALQATRVGLTEALKGTGEGGGGGGRARKAFVVAQLALTLMLVHGTALLVGSYSLLRQRDQGFDPENVLTMSVSLSSPSYDDEGARLAFFLELMPRLADLPGVRVAAAVNRLPFEGGTNDRIMIEGRENPTDPNERPLVERKTVVGDYQSAMGIPLGEGRALDERDAFGVPATVINQRMADRLWPDESPLGKRFSFGDEPGEWLTVVGVVADVSPWGPEWGTLPEAYRPYALYPSRTMYLVLKTDVPPSSLVAAARRVVGEVDANMAVREIRTGATFMAEHFAQRRLVTLITGVFAVLALILAVAGIYGIIAYYVTEHTYALGVRMALGADRVRVLRLILGRGLALAGAGVGLGIVGAYAAAHIAESFLFGLGPTDPWFLDGVVLLLLSVSVAAILLPARRATMVHPAQALRAE
jgi:predicted permease